ncbi:rhomboid family intramembrane serine protease [Candidatus Bathyarchaeota archaeon]|nr:rhomboid family intramembrane serine protease [Candidatus Bathyarchaeota archaeon]
MLPLKDLNRPFSTPHVNRMLLIVNVVIFVVYWFSAMEIYFPLKIASQIKKEFTMYPGEVVHGQRLYTLVTSMFMHADWFHLLGNMLFLYIFGDNVEDVLGHASYLAFYISCGLAAAFSHILSLYFGLTYNTIDFSTGVIGASGAISGVLGAYFVLFPKARILAWVVYFILPVPAVIFLGFWFFLQWFYGLFNIGSKIAYWAHVGGFIAGMVLALAFGLKRKREKMAKLLR